MCVHVNLLYFGNGLTVKSWRAVRSASVSRHSSSKAAPWRCTSRGKKRTDSGRTWATRTCCRCSFIHPFKLTFISISNQTIFMSVFGYTHWLVFWHYPRCLIITVQQSFIFFQHIFFMHCFAHPQNVEFLWDRNIKLLIMFWILFWLTIYLTIFWAS